MNDKEKAQLKLILALELKITHIKEYVKKEIPILVKSDNLTKGTYTIMVSVESGEITQSIPIKLVMR